MTCYTRHLGEVLRELGMEETKEGRRALDMRIRSAYSLEGARCPEVWQEVKARLHDPAKRAELVERLKKA